MAKIFNRGLRVGYDAVTLSNGTIVKVKEFDIDGSIMRAFGTTVPTAGKFAKGALFVKTDAASGTKSVYENQGTTDSVSFNLMGEVSSTEVVLADGGSFKTSDGEEVIEWGDVATAINHIKITNAAIGNGPIVEAKGDDTNVAVTLKGKGTGHIILGQATTTDVRLAADQPIADSSGNEYIKFSKAASAVNEVTIANGATGSGVSVSATGGDANIAIKLSGKGTGAVGLGQATSTGVRLEADQPILDSSDNEYLKFVKTASAVNEITVTNAATGTPVVVSTTGGDANIDLALAPKGTGFVAVRSTDGGALGAQLVLSQAGGTQANSDVVSRVIFQGQDSVAASENYGQIDCVVTDITAASPDADLVMYADVAGTMTEILRLGATGIQHKQNSAILDSNANELFKFTATGSAVNEFTIVNAATTDAPVISATGGDANIGIDIKPKGNEPVAIISSDPGALGAQLVLGHAGGSQANSDVAGRILFSGQDSLAAEESYAKIDVVVTDITAASPDADMIFYTDVAGTLTERMRISSGSGVVVGADGVAASVSSKGAANLTAKTGSGTGAQIVIVDGAAGGIRMQPNATGSVSVESTDGGILGAQFTLAHSGGSQANSDVVGRVLFNGEDAAVALESYAKVDVIAKDITALDPDGIMAFYVDKAGTLTEKMRIDADLDGLQIGTGAADAILQSSGNFDLILRTGNATTGSITIADGAAGNITLAPNGTGKVILNNGTDPVILELDGAAGGANNVIADVNGNEIVTLQGVASAVNEVAFTNAATTVAPSISATGGDANVSLNLVPKGTGIVQFAGTPATGTAVAGAVTVNAQVSVITSEALTTAANATYTLTITNNKVAATSACFVTMGWATNSAGRPVIEDVTPGAGSLTVVVRNYDASAALNGSLNFNVLVH